MAKSREIFDESGNPENPEKPRILEEQRRAYHAEEVEWHGNEKEIEELLQSVDFAKLRKLFLDRAVRSGIDPAEFNFLGSDRIVNNTEIPLAAGNYFVEENLIGLRYGNIKILYQRIPGIDLRLASLATLIHEETHATQKSECRSLDMSHEMAFYRQTKSGFSAAEKTDASMFATKSSTYNVLNEGITEKLSREILDEYLENSNFAGPDQINSFFEIRKNQVEELPYQKAVKLAEALILLVAKENGQTERVVWEAFVRGAYQGDSLDDPEISELLSSTSVTNLATRIRELKFGKDLDGLIEEIEQARNIR